MAVDVSRRFRELSAQGLSVEEARKQVADEMAAESGATGDALDLSGPLGKPGGGLMGTGIPGMGYDVPTGPTDVSAGLTREQAVRAARGGLTRAGELKDEVARDLPGEFPDAFAPAQSEADIQRAMTNLGRPVGDVARLQAEQQEPPDILAERARQSMERLGLAKSYGPSTKAEMAGRPDAQRIRDMASSMAANRMNNAKSVTAFQERQAREKDTPLPPLPEGLSDNQKAQITAQLESARAGGASNNILAQRAGRIAQQMDARKLITERAKARRDWPGLPTGAGMMMSKEGGGDEADFMRNTELYGLPAALEMQRTNAIVKAKQAEMGHATAEGALDRTSRERIANTGRKDLNEDRRNIWAKYQIDVLKRSPDIVFDEMTAKFPVMFQQPETGVVVPSTGGGPSKPTLPKTATQEIDAVGNIGRLVGAKYKGIADETGKWQQTSPEPFAKNISKLVESATPPSEEDFAQLQDALAHFMQQSKYPAEKINAMDKRENERIQPLRVYEEVLRRVGRGKRMTVAELKAIKEAESARMKEAVGMVPGGGFY